MPRPKKEKEVIEKGVYPEIPKFQLSETGYTGLKIAAGLPIDELKRELQYPQSMITYKQMSYHSTIAAALALYELMISKVHWKVLPPENPTPEDLKRTEFIKECMHDMDHSWMSFIQEAGSCKTFGFSVHEKVFRKRLKSKGSKYDDGLIGWKKLPIRAQDTIYRWYYSEDGRDLIACKQLVYAAYKSIDVMQKIKPEVIIPRSKFLLFRTGKHKDNPFGRSCLRDCFYAWKFLTMIEETEASGILRDLQGLPVLFLPPQYMTEDATPEQKAIYQQYQNIMRNIQQNQQAGLILPQAFDPETKQPLFKFDLMGVQGGKSYDTTKIKEYYKNSILTTLFADLLIMGQGSTGSYALGSIKSNLMAVAIETLLREISDVLNNDLIRHTFELNGWPIDRLPQLMYEDFENDDLEAFSKAVQRYASTSVLEIDRPILNKIRESLGVEGYAEDQEPQYDLMPNYSSRSGDGMATVGEGTSNSVSGKDTSSNNLENVG